MKKVVTAQFGDTAMWCSRESTAKSKVVLMKKIGKFWVDTLEGTTRQLALSKTAHTLRQLLFWMVRTIAHQSNRS
jgi:hypothetical protein